MSETTVYMVTTAPCYEGEVPLCAFVREEDARTAAAAWNAYSATSPVIEVFAGTTDEDYARREAQNATFETWRENHPVGYLWATSGPFEVAPLTLHT